MDFHEYSKRALRTASISGSVNQELAVCGLGLAGETGEVVELLKKHIAHGKPCDPRKLEDELGDVLWYLNRVASLFGLELEKIARRNVAKLEARYPDGFVKGGGIR